MDLLMDWPRAKQTYWQKAKQKDWQRQMVTDSEKQKDYHWDLPMEICLD
jgi:hypothetical protein